MKTALKNKKSKRELLFECIYYVYFSLVLFVQFMDTTLIKTENYRPLFKFAILFFGILVVFKIVFEWKKAWSLPAIVIGVVCVGGILLPVLNFLQDLTIAVCLLILGARNISSKKILQLYVIISFLLTVFVVYYCLSGHVDDFTVYRDANSTVKRHAFGFVYATYFSSHLMGICTVWAYVRGKFYTWFEAILTIAIGVVTYKYTEARISCTVIVATAIVMIIYKICELKKYEIKIIRNKIIKIILICAADIVAVISIILGLVYRFGNPIFEKLNDILGLRLMMNAIAFKRHSISLWGQRITIVGGHTDGEKGIEGDFFMLNNSFIETLFYLGLVALAAALIGWTLISYRNVKNNEYYKLLILDLIVVYSFFEQRWLAFCIVPFWVLLLSDKKVKFFDLSKFSFYKKLIKYKKKIWLVLSMAALAFIVELVAFNFNPVMTCMNNRIDTLNDVDVQIHGLKPGIDDRWVYDYDVLKEGEKPGILLANIFSPLGVESLDIGFNFYEVDGNGYHYVENIDYSYDILTIGYDGNFTKVKTVECNSSKPATWYTNLDIDLPVVTLYVQFNYDEKYLMDVMKLDINGPVPYDFNPGRLALIWLILSALALVLSSGKKPENNDDEGSEDDSKEETTDNTEFDTSKEEKELEPESTTETEKV